MSSNQYTLGKTNPIADLLRGAATAVVLAGMLMVIAVGSLLRSIFR